MIYTQNTVQQQSNNEIPYTINIQNPVQINNNDNNLDSKNYISESYAPNQINIVNFEGYLQNQQQRKLETNISVSNLSYQGNQRNSVQSNKSFLSNRSSQQYNNPLQTYLSASKKQAQIEQNLSSNLSQRQYSAQDLDVNTYTQIPQQNNEIYQLQHLVYQKYSEKQYLEEEYQLIQELKMQNQYSLNQGSQKDIYKFNKKRLKSQISQQKKINQKLEKEIKNLEKQNQKHKNKLKRNLIDCKMNLEQQQSGIMKPQEIKIVFENANMENPEINNLIQRLRNLGVNPEHYQLNLNSKIVMQYSVQFNCLDDICYVDKNKTPVGTGAFSEVTLIYHKEDPENIYAMKKLHKKDETEEIYIKQEIQLHENLNHQHIIKLVDSFETSTHWYLILEHAQNGDLFEYLEKNPLTQGQLLKIFYQTVLAIQYLHQKNIIHRDIKPENLLLDKDLNIKLCDFGWSVQFQEGIKRQTLCGTYEYMAPETYYGFHQTIKADVWSLGILLFELTQGRPPFMARNINDFFKRIKNGQISYCCEIDQTLKNLIESILVFDPSKRLTTNQIIQCPIFDRYKCYKLRGVMTSRIAFQEYLKQNFSQTDFLQNKQDQSPFLNFLKDKQVEDKIRDYKNRKKHAKIMLNKSIKKQSHKKKSISISKDKVQKKQERNSQNDFSKKIKYSYQHNNLKVNILEKQKKPKKQKIMIKKSKSSDVYTSRQNRTQEIHKKMLLTPYIKNQISLINTKQKNYNCTNQSVQNKKKYYQEMRQSSQQIFLSQNSSFKFGSPQIKTQHIHFKNFKDKTIPQILGASNIKTPLFNLCQQQVMSECQQILSTKKAFLDLDKRNQSLQKRQKQNLIRYRSKDPLRINLDHFTNLQKNKKQFQKKLTQSKTKLNHIQTPKITEKIINFAQTQKNQENQSKQAFKPKNRQQSTKYKKTKNKATNKENLGVANVFNKSKNSKVISKKILNKLLKKAKEQKIENILKNDLKNFKLA